MTFRIALAAALALGVIISALPDSAVAQPAVHSAPAIAVAINDSAQGVMTTWQVGGAVLANPAYFSLFRQ
jgi:hypothetical protein